MWKIDYKWRKKYPATKTGNLKRKKKPRETVSEKRANKDFLHI